MPPNSALTDVRPQPDRTWKWVALPVGAILIAHWIIDTLSAVIPTLLGVVENEYAMHARWSAMLLGLGAVCSGLAQPVFAWASDRWNTRVFAALGLLLGAIGIGFIGAAPSVPWVFVFYAVGMIGIGMFHPIAASTIGRLAGNRRGLAISWFFVFGMFGFFTGSLLGPELATGNGSLDNLAILTFPALGMMMLLHLCIRKIEHRQMKQTSLPVSESSFPGMDRPVEQASPSNPDTYDLASVAFLYVACVFRFVVNMALIYLLVRWMEGHFASVHPEWSSDQVSDHAAPFIGRANATMIVGQGTGGLLAGALIKTGFEKAPLVWVPILFAPTMMVMSYLEPGWAGYTVVFLAGVGFASMTPVAISVGQRLMPYHTSLASGLMLGGAWAVGATGPLIAEFLYDRFGLGTALFAVGSILILSGLAATGVNRISLEKN